MSPLLQEKDYLIVVKKLHPQDRVFRGDVVTVEHERESLLKRVFAVPGDSLSINEARTKICNSNSTCIPASGMTFQHDQKELTVPEGHYFIVGDNYDHSYDSRHFPETFVARENIVERYFGKACLINCTLADSIGHIVD